MIKIYICSLLYSIGFCADLFTCRLSIKRRRGELGPSGVYLATAILFYIFPRAIGGVPVFSETVGFDIALLSLFHIAVTFGVPLGHQRFASMRDRDSRELTSKDASAKSKREIQLPKMSQGMVVPFLSITSKRWGRQAPKVWEPEQVARNFYSDKFGVEFAPKRMEPYWIWLFANADYSEHLEQAIFAISVPFCPRTTKVKVGIGKKLVLGLNIPVEFTHVTYIERADKILILVFETRENSDKIVLLKASNTDEALGSEPLRRV